MGGYQDCCKLEFVFVPGTTCVCRLQYVGTEKCDVRVDFDADEMYSSVLNGQKSCLSLVSITGVTGLSV